MRETPRYASLSTFSCSSNYSVVAPFAADITTSKTGSVRYSDSYNSQLSLVSEHICFIEGNSFNGTWMLVAEWNGVSLLSGSTVCMLIIIRYTVSTYIKIVQVHVYIYISVYIHSCACTVHLGSCRGLYICFDYMDVYVNMCMNVYIQ